MGVRVAHLCERLHVRARNEHFYTRPEACAEHASPRTPPRRTPPSAISKSPTTCMAIVRCTHGAHASTCLLKVCAQSASLCTPLDMCALHALSRSLPYAYIETHHLLCIEIETHPLCTRSSIAVEVRAQHTHLQ